MSNFWYGSVVMVTLILGPCAPSSSQQSSQSMINNQGVRALIAKNPPGKSDAEYASEINTCEGVSRRQMNDQANAYAGCMLHFGNRPNVGNGVLDNSTPSPQIRDPGIVAGPNPWVPPGPRRQTITPPASATGVKTQGAIAAEKEQRRRERKAADEAAARNPAPLLPQSTPNHSRAQCLESCRSDSFGCESNNSTNNMMGLASGGFNLGTAMRNSMGNTVAIGTIVSAPLGAGKS
jgi:hypothetical protein